MNKKKILREAYCHFDYKEGLYIVSSPLFNKCVAYGDSINNAWDNYQKLLEEYYNAYLEEKLINV